MSISSREVVEFVLLGPTNDRRQLQDSPILPDVWARFASQPTAAVDLLISPHKEQAAGPVAATLAARLQKLKFAPHEAGQEANVAYLQAIVAACLTFGEMIRVVAPLTFWWREKKLAVELKEYFRGTKRLRAVVDTIVRWSVGVERHEMALKFADSSALDRYVALAALILWAGQRHRKADMGLGPAIEHSITAGARKAAGGKDEQGAIADTAAEIATAGTRFFRQILDDPAVKDAYVYQISLNRNAMPAIERSVPAVKGDAARALFKVKCQKIAWAVLDSGIDAQHPAFEGRVAKAFDFSQIRKVMSLDNLDLRRARETAQALSDAKWQDPGAGAARASREAIDDKAAKLQTLAQDADEDRPINWRLVAEFVEVDLRTPPAGNHGTHVAGIIGADGSKFRVPRARLRGASPDCPDGMCPDIRLYDFRVLARTLQDTEFAIIAALQYIRHLNERHALMTIHGANLSLSIPHDVRNFACGRTPICDECERLVESGVVVVAAAGNLGYHSFETKDGSYEGYAAFSITDPGNADGVITVGATHRYWPHTYGVSFFSSRGPTGDGRMKPDLVAPGERIRSCLPQHEGRQDWDWGEMDGTSMAAPHVSGAAAMLLARYSELIGQPRRVKRILCDSATDLGRERSFQGSGMLDVLRAFQSI